MSRLLRAAALAVVTVVPAAHAQAPLQDTPVPMWVPNNGVFDAVKVGNTLVIGGTFDHVGPPTGAFAIAEAADASNLNTVAQLPSGVYDIVADGVGGWYVARESSELPRTPEVVHVLADGRLDPQFAAPPLYSVRALALDGGHLFVGGGFSTLGGAPRRALLALDPVTGAVQPWTPAETPLSISHLLASGGVLYTASPGTVYTSSGLALDVSTGASLPFPALQTGEAQAALGPRVYVITKASTTHTLSAHALDGTPLPTWTSRVFASVDGVVAAPSIVYAIVRHGTDTDPAHVVALDAATGVTVWSSPGFNYQEGAPRDLALDGNALYVGGEFGRVGAETRRRMAVFDATTGALQPWVPLIGGFVTAVAAADGRVAFGGGFSSVGGVLKRGLAALDLATGRPAAVQPPDSPAVFALTASGDLVVAATNTYPPFTPPEIFAFSAATGLRYPKALAVSGETTSLAISGGTLFIGGLFTAVDGQQRRNLAAYDLVAEQMLPWNPSPDNTVRALKVHAGVLYAVGLFRSVAGYDRTGAASFGLAFLDVTSWDPPHGGLRVYDVDAWHDRVFLGVEMGANVVRTLAVDRVSGAPLNVNQPFGPELAVVGGTLAMSGNGGAPPGTEQPLATVDAASGQGLPWNPQVYSFASAASALPPIVKLIGLDGYLVVTRSWSNAAPRVFDLLVYRPRVVLPGAPSQIRMTVVDSTVSLAWSPGAAPAPIAYVIEAGSAPGLSDLGRFAMGGATQVAAVVAPGSYGLRVRAVGASGEGPASSEWRFATPATPTPPGAPSGLVTSVAGNVVYLAWTAGAGNATTYVVEGGSAPGLSNLGVIALGSLDTAAAGAVPPGTYYLRVRAANAVGPSPPSNEAVVVVP